VRSPLGAALTAALATSLAASLALACSAPEPEPAPAPDAAGPPAASPGIAGFSEPETALLHSLSLASLPPPPASPSNRVADDPRAVALGRRLFFDAGLSADGRISCASCHDPARYFTDGRSTSMGLGATSRNAPTVVGAAYSPFLYWDGRRDSLWSQALTPLEASAEMGSTRLEVARRVTTHESHAADYRALFGAPPDLSRAAGLPARAGPFGDPEARAAWRALPPETRRAVDGVFADVGKAIAAYERTLLPAPSRFDRYVGHLLAGDAEAAGRVLDADEVAGLRLFIDPARTMCLRCHNGPLLSNQAFHDVATGRLGGVPDLGRSIGLEALFLDPFNCLGPHSDAGPDDCGELRFLNRREGARLTGAFKTPSLRGVSRTAPYLHNGALASLDEVVAHYREPPESASSELLPLALEDAEARQLVAFLRTLDGGVAAGPPAAEAPAP